ncbi:hypothetical protein SORBI_3005G183000 [Sorghum bicolor]|uniref:NB-ARC domain-containing protein n=1 Tax=Sorghum bicolor TaxID=4558 RepID=A0A1Z5RJU2_SORBI|nr:hypothetical protein SORBI_3005G183000 [Sorghum bicolor]
MADLVLGLAKSAVEGTLTMAKSAMEEEAKLKKGVQRDLMLISDEFEMMHSVLNVAKDHVTDDDVTRTLVRQVRNMALDVEDCIESGVHLEDKSNWWRRLLPPSCVPAAPPGADLDATVADMELLKARVDAMGHRNMRYSRVGDSSSKKPGNKQTQTQQQAVVTTTAAAASSGGIFSMVRYAAENLSSPVDLATLINKKDTTCPHQEQGSPMSSTAAAGVLRVISVVGTRSDLGMMSIRKAYDDPETCSSFRCRAWVKLMHPFNPDEFIRSLLAQFYKNYCPQQEVPGDVMEPTEVMVAADGGVIVEEFKKQMSKHKYLVVLEDLSSTMVDWEAVRAYLPDKNDGSCIVVHTQQLGMASLCVGHPHRVSELEKFSADHSVYVVFKQEADGNVEETVVNMKLKTAREWLNQHELIGHEEDLYSLFCTRFNGRVVSIWGMSGVGKTFLIKNLYYKLLTGWTDHMFGWVDVSHPLDLTNLSRSLLLDLNLGYLQRGIMPTFKDPIQACREYLLKHPRSFIVIDGLQSIEEWDLIKAVWDIANLSLACIVVITNEESVAKHCASDSYSVLNVQGLEIHHAMELFQDKVGGRIGDMIDEEGRRNIVRKCGGLPKVICAAADICLSGSYIGLHDSLRKDNLVSVLEANPLYIRENLEDLYAWLLSYFHSCPDFLKPCIFYLLIFPLNNTIRRRRLVRRWIAEGYARDNKERIAEENGEMSFSRLVNLSMIQVQGQRRSSVMMAKCQVNGFLREYIISRSMEENLVFGLEGQSKRGLQRTGRHLAIDESWDRDRNVFGSIDFSRLRSLTVFGRWESFFVSDKMRLLRVLDLEDVSSGVTNGDVELMVKLLPRLKFLSLRRCTGISRLPDSLGDLKQLQTLDIRETSVVKLPKSIAKLEKLQYIRAGSGTSIVAPLDEDTSRFGNLPLPVVVEAPPENPSTAAAAPKSRIQATTMASWLSKLSIHRRTDDSSHNGVKLPRGTGIGKLFNLHTLGVLNVSAAGDEGILEELKNLTQLHKLGVSGINKNNGHKFFSVISSLAHLKSLSVQVQLDEDSRQPSCLDGISTKTRENLQSLKLYGLLHRLPVWTKELQNLRKLSLHMIVLTQEGIHLLAGLQELRSLKAGLDQPQIVLISCVQNIYTYRLSDLSYKIALRAVMACGAAAWAEVRRAHRALVHAIVCNHAVLQNMRTHVLSSVITPPQ